MKEILRLQSVNWIRDNRLILNQVNWDVQSGQHWAIVGSNGAGKTTILRMITGYLWPSSGQIEVLGHRFGQVSLPELRKQIGWVSSALSQQIEENYAGQSALDIVISGKYASFGLWGESTPENQEEAFELLQQFQSESTLNLPFSALSQGQKQRVLIARAWMAHPDLLILDEPCTGLDLRSREGLLHTLTKMGQHKNCPTIIYVTHHVEEILPLCTHCMILKDGAVLASGEKQNVMTASTLSHALDVNVSVSWRNDRLWLEIVDKL